MASASWPTKKRECRGHQQDGDQDVFELSEKNAPGRDSVRSFKFIGTVLDQPAGRLPWFKPEEPSLPSWWITLAASSR